MLLSATRGAAPSLTLAPCVRPPARSFIVGESVLVHEMGHTVHLLGMGPCQAQLVVDRFLEAKASGAYSPGRPLVVLRNAVLCCG